MSEFKSCPVCQEQSDQCLPCGSYVVDGERIYYGKLKDFGATKDHEVRFINRIQKHRTTAFFHNGKLYIPSRQGRSVPLAIGLQWDAWKEQQAIIDDLIYKAKLRESDHRALLVKYQATKKCWEDVSGKCEELKTQLNNMEACYIEKKKELEELRGQIDVSKSSQPKLHKTDIGDCLHFSTTMFHDGKATCFDCDAVVNHKREVIGVMQTKALRGAND